MKKNNIIVIGGGLAGSEAAFLLANKGHKVDLYEMRGSGISTPAHKTDKLAELVCSNSFRSQESTTAIGLLHAQMRNYNSIVLEAADIAKVPAGSALAVDRNVLSDFIQDKIEKHPNINVIRKEITEIPSDRKTIIATGPLTSDKLSEEIIKLTGQSRLAFYDAIAPVVYKESLDFSKVWFQSRYDKGEGKDYINCPMTKEQYYSFVDKLLKAEKIEFKEWEKDTPYFHGCMPVEVMAKQGVDTLRFGPMKPVGLTNPNSDQKPYAVVQLRQDNKSGTLYNIVGFQTKMKYLEQKRVLTQIPGLENAEFARLGGLHRNTFIKSPILLDNQLRLKNSPNVRFAGQITGVEGYIESASIGILAGLFLDAELNEEKAPNFSKKTPMGALISHITEDGNEETFQPMNVNFGLFESDFKVRGKQNRKAMYSKIALEEIKKQAS